MWSRSHEFAKHARELERAHADSARNRTQLVLLCEALRQMLPGRLNSFRIPRQSNIAGGCPNSC